ncbi:RHS repeat-associated core domain-containing protein [Neptuniibacter sp. QD57_21]|uniref:RHS repeat-associated core domain-containing protein n=1 Tax=Neptuniibacter sp. QD57_21 TaxID=3398213 RepID=UPI0039F46FE4
MSDPIADIEKDLREYPDSLKVYREFTEEGFVGRKILSSLRMDRTMKVGGQSGQATHNQDLSVVAVCPENGILELEVKFESVLNVPITDVKVTIIEIDGGLFYLDKELPSKTVDEEGKVTFTDLNPGSQYRFEINQDATESDLDGLFASYDGFIADNHAWLTQQWNVYKPEWNDSFVGRALERAGGTVTGFFSGIWGALKEIWDGITQAFDLLKDPASIPEKLGEEFAEIAASVKSTIESAPKIAEKAMLFASDEAAMFLLVKRVLVWFSMLPPADFAHNVTEKITKFVAAIAIDIIIGLALGIVTAKFGAAGGFAYLAAKTADRFKDLGQWVIRAITAIKGFFDEMLEMVKKYADDLAHLKKVTVREGGGVRLHKQGDNYEVRYDKDKSTTIEQSDSSHDSSNQGNNNNGDSVDSNDNTVTNSCPVSMVTGEELLELEDARLPGLIELPFVRTYRTSNCENSNGLGFGWSHSFSHKLKFTEDNIEWHDHQGRVTPMANPEEYFGSVTNKLAGSAIYLGKDADEYILTSESTAPYFFHFKKYGNVGYLSAISDRYQNRLEIRYDSDRRIIRVESEQGYALGLQYHGISALISRIDLLKREDGQWRSQSLLSLYEYSQSHQLLKAENAQGEAEAYEYDQQNVIQKRCLAGGAEFYWQWQGEGKAVKAIRHWANFEQMDVRYEWSDDGSVLVSYHDGSSQSYQHDDNARLIKQVDPDGAVTEKKYGDKGELLEDIDPLGNKTEYKYNLNQQLVAVLMPDGSSIGYEYRDGHLTAKHQGKRTWRYKHNELGDLTSETDPLGQTTQYAYNENGLVSAIHYPDGSASRYNWNRLGQLLDETSPDGGITRYRYDSLGRRIWQQSPTGGVTEFGWDSANRLVSVREPGNKHARTYTYNPYGKVTSVTDEHGHTTRYEYAKPLHLVTAKINPDGSRVEYKYDNAKLFLSQIRNERGEECLLDYHPNGLIAKETSFDGRVTRYNYDLNGQLIEKVEQGLKGAELLTFYERDSLGRLIVKTLPDDSKIEYQYDQYGRLVEVDDGEWPLAYEYDLNGQLTMEHQGWGTLHYGYDPMGRINAMRLPDHQTLDYYYNSGRLSQLDLNGEMLTHHHHQLGREQYRQQGQLTSHYQYDDQGRLSAHTVNQRERHALDSSKTVHHQLYKRSYGYSDNGNLISLEDSRKGSKEYHYDALNRLQQVSGSLEEHLVHDPAGNLLDTTGQPSTVVKGNRVEFKGDRHYRYDEFGNLIEESRGKQQKLKTCYEYDCQHRLIKAEMPDGTVAKYCYDAFGRRISKTVFTPDNSSSSETIFFWQGDKLVSEVDEQSQQHTSYIYEPYTFKPMAMVQGSGLESKAYYYQLDHLGTPQELTDSQGKIVWSAHYRAYGQLAIAEVEEVTNPIRFQGQYHDLETGLYYNRHRYYDPYAARFTTIDPIGLAGGLNNYQYVPNPTGWVDPLGLASCKGNCPDRNNSPINYNTIDNGTVDEILSIPKGDRPAPSTYLTEDYMQAHEKMFQNGVARIQPEAPTAGSKIGRTETWVMPRSTALDAISEANGNPRKLENLLGMDDGYLGDNPVLIDIPSPSGYRIPTGNEFAAYDDYWRPGGFTHPGGLPEAVIDPVLVGDYTVAPAFKR